MPRNEGVGIYEPQLEDMNFAFPERDSFELPEKEKLPEADEEDEKKKTLQEQAAEELQRNEEAQVNLVSGEENLKQILGCSELNIISDATKTTFVEVNGEVFYQSEDGSLNPYDKVRGGSFKIEPLTVEQDFRGPEYGGMVKIYVGSYQDALGRTIHEFIEQTYRAPEYDDMSSESQDVPEVIENSNNKSEEKETSVWTRLVGEKGSDPEKSIAAGENHEQQKNVFNVESLFSQPENSITNNSSAEGEKNNFLSFEITSIENTAAINIISNETHEVAKVVTDEIAQSTVEGRVRKESVITESPTEHTVTTAENKVQKNEVQSSPAASIEHAKPEVASIEQSARVEQSMKFQTEKNIETPLPTAEQTILKIERQVVKIETSKQEENMQRPELPISITFSESSFTQEKGEVISVQETSFHPEHSSAEIIKSTMKVIAETNSDVSWAGAAKEITWGEQKIIDVLPAQITEIFVQQVQYLAESPVGTEMVIINTEAPAADNAFILRVEKPGSVTVELYKAPVEMSEPIHLVTEIIQPIAAIQETVNTAEPIVEPSKPSLKETVAKINPEEQINIKPFEVLSSERQERLSLPQIETVSNEPQQIGSNERVNNISELRSFTISSLFADDDEIAPAPTPRGQKPAARSRELAV